MPSCWNSFGLDLLKVGLTEFLGVDVESSVMPFLSLLRRDLVRYFSMWRKAFSQQPVSPHPRLAKKFKVLK